MIEIDNGEKFQFGNTLKINNRRITILSGLISLTGLVMGFEIGTANHYFKSEEFNQQYVDLSQPLLGFIISCFNLGSIIGCLIGAIIIWTKYDHVIKLGYVIYIIGAIINFVNQFQFTALLILYRVILGITNGIFLLISPIYITKLSIDKNKRGLNLSLIQFNICVGILFGNILSYVLNVIYLQYLINVVLIIIAILSFIFLPSIINEETNLTKLKIFFQPMSLDNDNGVDNERQLNEEEIKTFVDSIIGDNKFGAFRWKKLILCVTLMIFQPLTGINIFFYYSHYLIHNEKLIIIMPILNLIGSVIILKIIQLTDRKNILIFGSFALYFCYFVYNITPQFYLVFIIVLIFSSTWGPSSNILMNEISNMNLLILEVSIMTNFLVNFLLITFSNNFITIEGFTGRFSLISLFELSIVCSILFSYFLPETKDLSFEEIENIFQCANPK
ncbi:hexose transporter Hxt14p [[Candida] jaroonii]|uniref:Hexose transporter Hxt14p n=1 Tax=[Candida] jaroonii TaxID=467808 RepID=A0ACA9Y2Z9_9ASCO|nr:hexose transporter Hxt14p [[Candida] jaroonii]